jgi:PucR C-terminal helix-turn-helix domain/GGDEF-like domain
VEVEVPAIEQRVSAVAAAVGGRIADVTDDLVGLLTREILPLRGDERVVALLSASVSENVATVLHLFQHGMDPGRVEAPAAAIEYARRLAQRGVPIVALVRAYRIGHARFLHWCFEELANEAADGHIRAEATRRMTELSFTYVDRASEQVIVVYEEERDRWLHNRATVRVARVRSLLAEEDFDIDATESTLGYRLRRHHLGLVAWIREPIRGHEELFVLERAAAALARRAGAHGNPLFVPCDESSAWVWLPVGSQPSVADVVLSEAVDDPDVCISVGEPGDGVEGFRRTHRQALAAQAVALAAGPAGPSVTAFADIRPIALMASDLDATRAWVLDTLGPLAIDDDQHARLRTTLRVFLSTGGSYTSTADRLTMHKNTVHYRVNRAEEMRGRPIQADRLDVELALLACESLGPAVLQAVD